MRILLPSKLASYGEFAETILQLREDSIHERTEANRLIGSSCYLLGWFLGDLGKHYRNESKMRMDIDIQLTRKHPENLLLGEYVADCIRNLGIVCKRTHDRPPRHNLPSGAYTWGVQQHSIFPWFHLACLGLTWNERTSYDPVRMEWMFSAPREARLWFLRGVADSDGNVHFRDKSVDITTSPNTNFFKALLDSLGVHSVVRFTKGHGVITIRANDAERIKVFNPEINTYRSRFLERLVGANVYPRHWPDWLTRKASHLGQRGLNKREISERILDEDNVYVKMYSLGKKIHN